MLSLDKIISLKKHFKDYYHAEGAEKFAFIKIDNERVLVQEVINLCTSPGDGFVISGEDIKKHAFDSIATMHTHPSEVSLLSGEDWMMFKIWPDLHHFIVGNDGVRCYKYNKDRETVMEIK